MALPPSRLTQADVLVHGGDRQPAPASPLPLLVMNVIGAPQPSEVFPWNGQLPTPMGNTQASETGGAIGGLATAIADVAVIGVPSDKWGESPRAIVVLAPGEEADEAGIIAFARERLATYKCPIGVDFTNALPRNPSGKILKKDLRAPHWEGRGRQVN